MEVSSQGFPKLTGFAAIRKGSARRILHELTAPVSSTSHEQYVMFLFLYWFPYVSLSTVRQL